MPWPRVGISLFVQVVRMGFGWFAHWHVRRVVQLLLGVGLWWAHM